MATDNVNHPRHYTSHASGVECITVTEHMNFCVGNAVKYLFRVDEKNNPIEDLRKASWYIEREIDRRLKDKEGNFGKSSVSNTEQAEANKRLAAYCDLLDKQYEEEAYDAETKRMEDELARKKEIEAEKLSNARIAAIGGDYEGYCELLAKRFSEAEEGAQEDDQIKVSDEDKRLIRNFYTNHDVLIIDLARAFKIHEADVVEILADEAEAEEEKYEHPTFSKHLIKHLFASHGNTVEELADMYGRDVYEIEDIVIGLVRASAI